MKDVYLLQLKFKILFILYAQDRKYDADCKSQLSSDDDEAADYQGGKSGNKSSAAVIKENRNKRGYSDNSQKCGQQGKESKWLVVAVHFQHSQDDTEAIGKSIQFGDTADWTVTIVDDDIIYLHIVIHSMYGHFGFYLEALGYNGKGLDELIAESTIASHYVLDGGVEEMVYAAAHQIVAEVVEGTLVLREICAGEPVAYKPCPHAVFGQLLSWQERLLRDRCHHHQA